MNALATPARPPLQRLDHLHVGGWVKQPLRLDRAMLGQYEPVQVPGFQVVCTLDGPHGDARPLRGVRLRQLIEAAHPAFAQRTDFKRVAVVAESAEGYRALFSWNELFNASLGEGVLVAWNCPEAPLPTGAGSFALVSLHDRATGPRYVQRLASVDLHKLW